MRSGVKYVKYFPRLVAPVAEKGSSRPTQKALVELNQNLVYTIMSEIR